MPVSTTQVSPKAVSPSNARRSSIKVLNRNIDQVVLGNLLFRTWYYSPYPDSIILDESQHTISASAITTSSSTGTSTARRPSHGASTTNTNGVTKSAQSNQTQPAATTAQAPSIPMACPRLHVCPYCFRYTPNSTAYIQHLRRHNVTYNPYAATSSSIDIDADTTTTSPPNSPTSTIYSDPTTYPVPSSAIKVYEHNGYTVWDIDGEREKLYCQNLSLFGKLFLEQKSVFFDTGGFHYFVLTYTSAAASPQRKRTSAGANAPPITMADGHPTTPEEINLHTSVLGFFSKENLSWDANNLACILVFPPYQHRNLGQLLMAVSYKLSGWEWEDSVIGGPEKPLSAMGRRSYLRFWSERIARFVMGQTTDADGRVVFEGKRKRRKTGVRKEEMFVKDIGERTGMLTEDVIAALSDMGILEVVPLKRKKKKKKSDRIDGAEEEEEGEEERECSDMIALRSRVVEWAQRKGVDLSSPVQEEGFLGEWALSEVEEEGTEEDEVDEGPESD